MSSSWVALTAPPSSSPSGASSSSAAIYSYLEKLPAPTLARLYASPSSALAILRLLPLSARHIALNLLWIEYPLPISTLSIWFTRRSEGKKQLEGAVLALRRLHIAEQPEQETLVLNRNFQKSLKRALTGGGSHNSFGVPVPTSQLAQQGDTVDIPFLDDHANKAWENILHYLVGSNMPTAPAPAVLATLKATNLMSGQLAGRHGLKITSKGFQFLLEDTNTQLWDILLHYLNSRDEANNAGKGMANGSGHGAQDVVEILGGLFMLGSLELGKAYRVDNLSSQQRSLLADLKDYGMVYFTQDPSYFYPTRLSTTLTSNAPPLLSSTPSASAEALVPAGTGPSATSAAEQGYIVLETNYRVYAYTSNPLQIAVLNLFVTLKSRFPNLVIGQVTRESIKAALGNGITAEQIVAYLSTHAHPQLRKQTPLLPPTVVDQIRLWELEKNRITETEGFLYEDFRTQSDFGLVFEYAKQLECVLWEDQINRKFFVGQQGHQVLRDFIKRRMAMAQGQGQPGAASAPGTPAAS